MAQEVVVAFSSNKKKRIQFFRALQQAAANWHGYVPHPSSSSPSSSSSSSTSASNSNNEIEVTVKLIPLFPDEHDDGNNEQQQIDTTTRIHAIIHKRTDDMAASIAHSHNNRTNSSSSSSNSSCVSTQVMNNVHRLTAALEYYSEHQGTCIIDAISGVWKLLDRCEIAAIIDNVLPKHSLPWTAMNKSGLKLKTTSFENVKFPIILKRRSACGLQQSHDMIIAYTAEAAAGFMENKTQGEDIIIQEYINNHGNVIFKVYAIAEKHIVIQPRHSVNLNMMHEEDDCFVFNSHDMNKMTNSKVQFPHIFDRETGRCINHTTAAVMPGLHVAKNIVAKLLEEFGVSLIGVDMIYDVSNDNFFIVDVNYFPGYKGVSNANHWLLQHICDQVFQPTSVTSRHEQIIQ